MTMLSAAAATIGDSLGKDVSHYLQGTSSFRQKNEREFQELWAQCDKLARADAVGAMALKATLCVAAGELEEALYYVRNIKLNRSPVHTSTLCTVLVNFGKFSESLPVYRELMMAPDQVIPEYFHLGVGNGAYSSYLEALNQVRDKMQLNSIFPDAEDSIRSVVSILEMNHESEETISLAMDIAGDILREHRLLFDGLHHALRPVPFPYDGGPAYFGVEIGVEVDDETAFDMTCEYAERLAASDKAIPVSMVLKFKSIGEESDGE